VGTGKIAFKIIASFADRLTLADSGDTTLPRMVASF
jgi:hypothetical protein